MQQTSTEFKTRNIWVIHWELCKWEKFDLTDNWYMHKPETVQENKTRKILWEFVIKNESPNPIQKIRCGCT